MWIYAAGGLTLPPAPPLSHRHCSSSSRLREERRHALRCPMNHRRRRVACDTTTPHPACAVSTGSSACSRGWQWVWRRRPAGSSSTLPLECQLSSTATGGRVTGWKRAVVRVGVLACLCHPSGKGAEGQSETSAHRGLVRAASESGVERTDPVPCVPAPPRPRPPATWVGPACPRLSQGWLRAAAVEGGRLAMGDGLLEVGTTVRHWRGSPPSAPAVRVKTRGPTASVARGCGVPLQHRRPCSIVGSTHVFRTIHTDTAKARRRIATKGRRPADLPGGPAWPRRIVCARAGSEVGRASDT